jgi:hypothetical protein
MYSPHKRGKIRLVLFVAICTIVAFAVSIGNAQDMKVDVVNLNGNTQKCGREVSNQDLKITVSQLGNPANKVVGAKVTIKSDWGDLKECTTLDDGPDKGTCIIEDLWITLEPKVFVTVERSGWNFHKRRIKIAQGNKEASIRDCPHDDFLLPSYDLNGNQIKDADECIYWDSYDIHALEPMYFDTENYLTAFFTRDEEMAGWKVRFYWAHPGIGLTRGNWHLISEKSHATGWPEYLPMRVWTKWIPSDIYLTEWEDVGYASNHYCFFVEVDADDDPSNERNNPLFDNNLAQDNYEHCFWDWCEPPSDKRLAPPPAEEDTCFEARYSFLVKNPDSALVADVILHVKLQDWPPDMQFTLTPSISPDPDFIQIDASTFKFQNMAPMQEKIVNLSITSSHCDDTGIIHINGTIDSLDIGGLSVKTIPPECPLIEIEKKHDVLQGHFVDISITAQGGIYEMGGFDFLIAYEASALAFIEADPGQFLEDCGWEYFTYRHGPTGNCGDACPSGMLRIIAMAETSNGPNHPFCYGPSDCGEYELIRMTFFVSNDLTFECQFVPVYFYWDDCGDNTFSSVDGEILYIERRVHDHENNIIWDEADDINFPEDNRIPFVGAPDYCLNTDPTKPPIRRCPVFRNGGVDIICADSIDARGDINVNGVVNEIADAVMFTNYFISGLSAFGDYVEASIAASDVNADGIALSVADLVYLVRVITGDAPPYPKAAPYAMEALISTMVNHSAAAVLTNSSSNIGAGYFVFEHSELGIGEPQLINGASDMTLKYSDVNGVLKVLVYSMEKGVMIPSGTENIFAIPIAGEGSIELREAELSDYYGNLLEVTLDKKAAIPTAYALHQNYPNPFNLSTTIIYELPEATDVTIEIFNVLGQKVSTLLDGRETAGVHSISWQGTDESGTIISSGVYFYRISTPGFSAEKKMVLMK